MLPGYLYVQFQSQVKATSEYNDKARIWNVNKSLMEMQVMRLGNFFVI